MPTRNPQMTKPSPAKKREKREGKDHIDRSVFCRKVNFPPGYATKFTVGVQTFTIADGLETMADARWFRAMFIKALRNLASQRSHP